MKFSTLILIATLSVSLVGCSYFRGQSEAKKAKEAAEKADRITMVLDERQLEPDPGLAGVKIMLPEAVKNLDWPQTGLRSSKVLGHVAAGENFKIAWRADAGRGSDARSALSTPPVTSESAVFTLDAEQTVYAFDIFTGKRLWDRKLDSGLPEDPIGYGGGLAVDGERLIVTSGYGFIAALNSQNGEQLWRHNMDSPMTGAPTLFKNYILATSNNNELFVFDSNTGDLLWSDLAIAEPARVLGATSPAAVDGTVIAPFSSGEVIAYLLANGQRLWDDALARPGRFTPISAINDIAGRPVIDAGRVFVANQSGTLLSIEGRSGGRVWAAPIGTTEAPALVDDTLFVMGGDGRLIALQASTGAVYWIKQLQRYKKERTQKGRVSYAGPLIASDKIIVANTRGEVQAIHVQTGEILNTLNLVRPIFLEPVAAQGMIFILTDDADLYAIE